MNGSNGSCVIIPYKSGSSEARIFACLAVERHLIVAGFSVRVASLPSAASWSPGAARSEGARVFNIDDPLVFNDADTICPPAQMFRAIELAEEAPGLVFAYDLYCRLTREMTERVRDAPVTADGFDGEWGRMRHEGPPILNSGSMGCVAISRACFEEVGGFDESYVGWGYEDLDFATRCNALWPNRRVTGPVFHLWHGDRRADDAPDDSDPDQVKANEARWQASTV